MNKRVIVIAFILFSIQLFAQKVKPASEQVMNTMNCYVVKAARFSQKVVNEIGEQFLNDDFIKGSITLANGKEFNNLDLNYNKLIDKVLFLNGLDTMTFLNPEELKIVNIGDSKFVYSWYKKEKDNVPGFFELLADGSYKLLLKHEHIYINEELALPYETPKGARYKFTEVYYLKAEKNNAVAFLNKGQLKRNFKKYNIKISPIFKEYKLKYRKVEDLKEVFNQLNKNLATYKKTEANITGDRS